MPHRLLGAAPAPVDDVIARVARDAPLERRAQTYVHGGGVLLHGGECGGCEDHRRLAGSLCRDGASELGERAVELQQLFVDSIRSSRRGWQPESEEDEPAAEALLELLDLTEVADVRIEACRKEREGLAIEQRHVGCGCEARREPIGSGALFRRDRPDRHDRIFPLITLRKR